jgi:titin
MLPSTYLVTNTGDSAQAGSGSLRRAIMDSNATPGPNVIKFNIITIPGQTTPPEIMPTSALPIITHSVTIDGTSQPNFGMVQLDGSSSPSFYGLFLKANGCHLKGLDVTHWDDGIEVHSNNNQIDHNLIGIDSNGAAAGNSVGLLIEASSNQVHDNVISGNTSEGVEIEGTIVTGNTLKNNKIGTDASGEKAVGNEVGVQLDGTNNTVLHNLISGNSGEGIEMFTTTIGNTIEDNLIGTDLSGEKVLGNEDGVQVDGSNNKVLDNLISGSSQGAGVQVFGNGSGDTVQGNLIGTDMSGTKVLGNSDGIEIFGHNDTIRGNTIGGSSHDGILLGNGAGNQVIGNFIGLDKTWLHQLPNATGVRLQVQSTNNLLQGNFIYYNTGTGVELHDAGTTGNKLYSNEIGFNGGDGVLVADQASGNQIGSAVAGTGNRIYENGGAGVAIGNTLSDLAVSNSILGNSIYGNTGLGIDLGSDGPTPNAPSNPALGANYLQNHPVLSSASNPNGSVTVNGSIHTASGTHRLEFFLAVNGQGMIYLGSLQVTTNANGDATFSHSFTTFFTQNFPTAGWQVVATATDFAGNTSEFSDPVLVQKYVPPPPRPSPLVGLFI